MYRPRFEGLGGPSTSFGSAAVQFRTQSDAAIEQLRAEAQALLDKATSFFASREEAEAGPAMESILRNQIPAAKRLRDLALAGDEDARRRLVATLASQAAAIRTYGRSVPRVEAFLTWLAALPQEVVTKAAVVVSTTASAAAKAASEAAGEELGGTVRVLGVGLGLFGLAYLVSRFR